MANDSGQSGNRLASVIKRVSNLMDIKTNSQDDIYKQFWMPDGNCKECYECGGHFTTFRRRHHCRICGQIFCSKCCYLEIPGKAFGMTGALRACNYCCSFVSKYSAMPPDHNVSSRNQPNLIQENSIRPQQNSSIGSATGPNTNPVQITSANGERRYDGHQRVGSMKRALPFTHPLQNAPTEDQSRLSGPDHPDGTFTEYSGTSLHHRGDTSNGSDDGNISAAFFSRDPDRYFGESSSLDGYYGNQGDTLSASKIPTRSYRDDLTSSNETLFVEGTARARPSSTPTRDLELLGLGAYLSSLYEKMQHPVLGLKLTTNRIHFKTYTNTISGEQIVEWLIRLPSIKNREQALYLAQALLDFDYITSATRVGRDKNESDNCPNVSFRQTDLYKHGLASVLGINAQNSSYDPSGPVKMRGDHVPPKSWGYKDKTVTISSTSSVAFKVSPTPHLPDSHQDFSKASTSLIAAEFGLKEVISADKNMNNITANEKLPSSSDHKYIGNSSLAEDGKDIINRGILEAFAFLSSPTSRHTPVPSDAGTEPILSPVSLSHLRSMIRQRLWFEGIAPTKTVQWEDTILGMSRKIVRVIDMERGPSYDNSNNNNNNICSCVKIKKLLKPTTAKRLGMTSSREETTGGDLDEGDFDMFPGLVFTQNLVHKNMSNVCPTTNITKHLYRCTTRYAKRDSVSIDDVRLGGTLEPRTNGPSKGAYSEQVLLELNQPSVLMMRGPIEYQRVERKLASLEPIIMQEREYMRTVVAKVAALRPDVVIVLKPVCLMARNLMLEAGIALIHNVKKERLFAQLASLMEAEVVRSSMEGGHIFHKPRLGMCRTFRVEKRSFPGATGAVKAKTLVFVEACRRGNLDRGTEYLPFCTVLMYGWPTLEETKKLKRILRFATFTAYHLKLLTSFRTRHSWDRSTDGIGEGEADPRNHGWCQKFGALMELKNYLFYPSLTPKPVSLIIDGNDITKYLDKKPFLYRVLLKHILLSITPAITFDNPYLDCLEELISTDPNQMIPYLRFNNYKSFRHLHSYGMLPPRLYYTKYFVADEAKDVVDSDNAIDTVTRDEFNKPDPAISDSTYVNVKQTLPTLPFPTNVHQLASNNQKVADYMALFRYDDRFGTSEDDSHKFFQNDPSSDGDTEDCSKEVDFRKDSQDFGPVLPKNVPDCFDVTQLQKIHFLFYSFSSHSENYPSYCIAPWIVTMHFYGLHDVTLFIFLQRFCYDPAYACPSTLCQAPCSTHVRRFVHGNTSVNVSITNSGGSSKYETERCDEPTDHVDCWTGCQGCGAIVGTPRTLSHHARQLSFGKFLEHMVYEKSNHYETEHVTAAAHSPDCPVRPDIRSSALTRCTYRRPIQYFAHRNVVACFAVTEVTMGNILFPPSRMIYHNTHYEELRRVCLNDIECLTVIGYNVFNSINERLLLYSMELTTSDALVSNLSTNSEQSTQSSAVITPRCNEMCTMLERDRSAFKELLDGSQIMLTKFPIDHMSGPMYDIPLPRELDENVYMIENILCEAKSLLVRCIYSWNPRLNEIFNICRNDKSNRVASSNLERDVDKLKEKDTKGRDHSYNANEGLLTSVPLNRISTISSRVSGEESIKDLSVTSIKLNETELVTDGMKPNSALDWNENSQDSERLPGSGITSGEVKKEVTFTANFKNKLASLLSSNTFDPIPNPFSPFEHYNLPFNANDRLRIVVSEEMPSSIIAFTLSTMEYEIMLKEIRRLSGSLLDFALFNAHNTNAPASYLNSNAAPVFYVDKRVPEVQDIADNSSHSFPSKEHATPNVGYNSTKVEQAPNIIRDKESKDSKDLSRSRHIEINFQDDTTTAKFSCKIYYAEDFARLRSIFFPKGEVKYARSLSHSLKWFSGGGKSGSSFSKTRDGRFLIKQMSRLELQSFLTFAPSYVDYLIELMEASGPKSNERGTKITALAKILGAYKVTCKNPANNTSVKQDFIVMENLFYDKRSIKRIFDLKGSTRNRMVNVEELPMPVSVNGGHDTTFSSQPKDSTLETLEKTRQPSDVKEPNASTTKSGNKGNTSFTSLTDDHFQDWDSGSKLDRDSVPYLPKSYSLPTLQQASTPTNDKPVPATVCDTKAFTNKINHSKWEESDQQLPSVVLLDENFIRMTLECPLYLYPYAKLALIKILERDTQFLADHEIMDYSLLVAVDGEGNEEYIVGIIDYIRTFTWDKRLEMVVKKSGLLGGQGKTPTIISPTMYRARFIDAMKRYFLASPDHWYGLATLPFI